ncbi:MAG TPA: TonB family protein [Thermoanaerobaculia bacterium]|jgi:TonB family protein|nr:TonB family protein [Thermoanaerobaculia bacterium]
MSKKVLLIEYEPRYIERIRTLLAPLGHTVTEAHDGEAGLQAFGASRFDLILLSGMLPLLPSAEVIREVRKKGGATAPPIILMMTGYRGSNRKADAQKVGAFDILVRPFTDEDFLGSVRDGVDATDVGSRTMRIETAQVAAAASPLTSSDIFSDLLDELTQDAPRKAPPAPAPPPAAAPPAAATPAAPPAPARAAPVETDMDKRLRDTLSGLMPSRPSAAARSEGPSDKTPTAAPAPPAPAAPPRPKLSSDTDVDRMISDTLSGLSRPKPKPPLGATPAPASAPPAAVAAPRKREEPAAAVASSGPDRFGQYEVLERIAAGGMAELYKAKRTGVEGFQKIVAIKKILPHLADDEEFVTMFADEAKLAAQLNHPNIIHIYDLGKIQAGGYFIAMEYVDGRDLRAIQTAGSAMGVPLPVPLAVYVASKVASALDYAHRRRDAEGHELNIVHRDVSPQNILISYEGDIKLCDFGIAKAASKASSKTQSGALKGKIQYMSPEQAWGKPIDRRSDLFSLGVVLHELLTGERLFRGDTDMNVLEKVRLAEVPAPSGANPEVPHNLDAVVLKALAKDPDDRYANASDLLRDLDSVLYSYTPAPGSADVAIYLHRLQAEEGAVAEAKAREAAHAVEEAEPAARKRKSKGAPISRKSAPAPKAPWEAAAPAPPSPPRPPVAAPPPAREPSQPTPEIFGSLEAKSEEAEKASRLPLILGIVFAALALLGFLAWRMMKPAAAPTGVLPRTPAAAMPTAQPTSAAAAAAPTPAAPAVDPKAVEAEVQRQLAARRKDLEKTATASKNTPAAAPASAPAVAPAAPAPAAAVAEPTAIPTLPPTAVPVPTAVPTEPPPPVEAPKPAPAREPETQRGDLVGPGAGVVEPALIAPPRVVYPPIARQQRVEGKVVVLVLIDETGKVAEARLQQGLSQSAINDAVVTAVKNAKFRAATKNGIPVKMWRPVLIEVKP